MKKSIFYIILVLCVCRECIAQQTFHGRILSASDLKPLYGASIKIKGSVAGTSADTAGRFSIAIPERQTILLILYLGYKSREIQVDSVPREGFNILLQEASSELQEVVVSTGYQEIPKERVTGSFIQLGKEELNRRVSPDILSRLEDMTSGLIFNRNQSAGANNISIRGRSTLFANSQPLIILDNFPFDGDINAINPNDVESITVLRDAAAASIWGARAGNGVIVITTKKGVYNRVARISFNSNLTVGDKSDLFYIPQMPVSDYIEIEKTLFNQGYYQAKEQSDRNEPLSPVVELLIAKRNGTIPEGKVDSQIEALKQQDVRNDINRYVNRNSINQQYAFNLNGGGLNQRYYVSAGYDRNESTLVGNNYQRVTANASNTYAFFKQRLELTTGLQYSNSNTRQPNSGFISWNNGNELYPYAKLSDGQGNSLNIIKDYRSTFVESARSKGLLDWQYNPLDETELGNRKANLTEYRINTGLRYKLTSNLQAEVLYQFNAAQRNDRDLHNPESYFTRNLVNRFTQTGTNGVLTRPIPQGGILDRVSGNSSTQNLRLQMSYNHNWKGNHELSSIVGYELKDLNTVSSTNRMYGYDDEHATGKIVDYLNPYKISSSASGTGYIQNQDAIRDMSDRFLSYYANAAYTYKHRYVISGSGRIDRSNLFGVGTNQKGVPLWSAGLAWNISNESFYKWGSMPYLKLRTTFGYNGNIDKSLSAYTTAVYNNSAMYTMLPFADIINPPNPELRWERVKILNFGLDFMSRNNWLSGSIEYYRKNGLNLIGSTPFPSSTGITVFRGNTADTRGSGLDVILNTRQINRIIQWSSNLLFSYGHEIVSGYSVKGSAVSYLESGAASLVPLEDRPLSAIYSYSWTGLDPATGDPLGIFNGQPSKNYSGIIQNSTPETLVYNGPSKPVVFGALRNTFSWKSLSLSANINYRLGYYFRKGSVLYSGVLSGIGGHGDYNLRWQKAGDEKFTSVPSMPASIEGNRDRFYKFASVLVYKGDHIRLKDINISYGLDKISRKWSSVKDARVYLYADNLGLIWKANKAGIDPDYETGPPPMTIAAGFKIDF